MPAFDKCNLFELVLQRGRAHDGEGDIFFHRIATRSDLEGYCNFIDYAEVPPGCSIGKHSHASDEEEFYLVLYGEGEMWKDGDLLRVQAGDLIRNSPGGTHGLRNVGGGCAPLVRVRARCGEIMQRINTLLGMDNSLRSVHAVRDETYEIICKSGVLSPRDQTLASVLRSEAPILMVSTPSVDRLYGERLRSYLATNCPGTKISFMVLPCSEIDKSIEQVVAVCQRAAETQLARRSQIVCAGGGVALDICGLAAALFRRGINSVRIPTTLIGMIDAGIGVKNGVNFSGSKSLLGSFSVPEACIIDPSFLNSLPRRYLRCGLAESIKIATVCSPDLFALLDAHAEHLIGDVCGTSLGIAEDLIQTSIQWTLSELELNLFERSELFHDNSYARKLDFGHTFSPHIEAASGNSVLHGEAVAIDMAVSAELARRLEILDETSRTRLLSLLRRVGLPIHWPLLDPEALHESLQSIVSHRNGELNLVLPAAIGRGTFLRELSEVSLSLLREVVQRLAVWSTEEWARVDARSTN